MTDSLVIPPNPPRQRRRAIRSKLSALKAFYKKHKQPIRGFLGWTGGLVLQIVVQNGGYEKVVEWDRKRWMSALIAAAIPGVVGWMKGGDSNPSDDELYDKVHKVKVKRAEEGLEVTDPNGLQLKKPAP